MRRRPLRIRDIVVVQFPKHMPRGREQEEERPAIIVGIPSQLGEPRFSMLIVVPLTTSREQNWAAACPRLYPKLAAGTGGLPRESVVLIDQVRSVDRLRLLRFIGSLTLEDYEPILAGLCQMLCP
ncbi:type II toxin-antitoxin system PemK/MazF family toxin [Gloeobacter violaceus]|uniref:type II toxin-antitoxin system PemK/MazF family toxin n=1 Tax=Gloeobacter violaceus TaxID=33072 RepID=UPI0013E8F2F6